MPPMTKSGFLFLLFALSIGNLNAQDVGPDGGGIHDLPVRSNGTDGIVLSQSQCKNLTEMLSRLAAPLQERIEMERARCEERFGDLLGEAPSLPLSIPNTPPGGFSGFSKIITVPAGD